MAVNTIPTTSTAESAAAAAAAAAAVASAPAALPVPTTSPGPPRAVPDDAEIPPTRKIIPDTGTTTTTTTVLLPPVTRGSSEDYLERAAMASARASTSYEFVILAEREKISHATSTPLAGVSLDTGTLVENCRVAALQRLRDKVRRGGSFVVEAGGFAAVACWEAQSISDGQYVDQREMVDREVRPSRPIFAEFLDKVGALQREFLEPAVRRMRSRSRRLMRSTDGGDDDTDDGRFWQLSLVARDPTVAYVPGAVRAVIAPLMDEFCSESSQAGPAPLWLVAGGRKARDMYEHFGFRDVGHLDIQGLRLWAMIYTAGLDDGDDVAVGEEGREVM